MKFLLALLSIATIAFAAEHLRYDVYYSANRNADGTWALSRGKSGVAWAILKNRVNSTGWFVLDVVSNASYSDELQSYAAGYLEGAVSQRSIWDSWRNEFTNGSDSPFTFPPKLKQFITQNDQWYRSMAKNPSSNKDFWRQVQLLLVQLDAMYDGYTAYAPVSQRLTSTEWLLYQYNWDEGDIMSSLGEPRRRTSPSWTPQNYDSHCSVLIKPSPDKMKLWTSHVTWTAFADMLRVYKHYNMPLKASKTPVISFSSYPGNVVSGDDFYVTSAQLTIMETTNDVYNQSLWQFTTTQTAPYWVRIFVANRLATNAKEWIKYGGLYNSGTYNNQYQIVDYKLFQPGRWPLKPETVMIVEQIPGYWVSEDVTPIINAQGYFPSYNIPAIPFIYNISGYPAMFEKFGEPYSYDHCARADIFRRVQPSVTTQQQFQHLMRWNKYQTDPESKGDACRGISARCDLNLDTTNNSYNGYVAFGAIDCKMTNEEIIGKVGALALSGPSDESQPIFWWNEEWAGTPHLGHPSVFHFPFIDVQPLSEFEEEQQ